MVVAEPRTQALSGATQTGPHFERAVRDYVRAHVRLHGQGKTAEALGVSRHTLWRFLERGHAGRAVPSAVLSSVGKSVKAIQAATFEIIIDLEGLRPDPALGHLRRGLEEALLLLCATPLATVEDLSRFGRIPASTLRDRLKKLTERGLADSVPHHLSVLGTRPQRRYFPTEKGVTVAGAATKGREHMPRAYPVSKRWFRRLRAGHPHGASLGGVNQHTCNVYCKIWYKCWEDSMDSKPHKLKAASKNILSSATSTADAVQGAAEKTLDSVAEKSKAVFREQFLGRIFSECLVPAFMLPTGPSPEDYVLMFRFDEMLDKLKSGILVRPKIEVWAARESGHDLERFQQELKQGFVCQFNEARESLIKARQPGIDDLEFRLEGLSDAVKTEATGPSLRSAAGWTLLTVTALPLLLFSLWLGFRPRTELIRLVWDYLSVRGEKKRAQQELDREINKLQSEFDQKDKAFQRAVKRIGVRVHPRIREVASLIHQAEGIFSPVSPEPEFGDIPDVEPYLGHPKYLEHVPKRYGWMFPSG